MIAVPGRTASKRASGAEAMAAARVRGARPSLAVRPDAPATVRDGLAVAGRRISPPARLGEIDFPGGRMTRDAMLTPLASILRFRQEMK